MTDPSPEIELLRGTLDMLILKALAAECELHGYGIARWLEGATEDALRVEEGSLYPALSRMYKRGWVSREWGVSEKNRRARFYRLTEKGREQLESEEQGWAAFRDVVARVLGHESA